MNKIYSKVWNASIGAVVVASELASSNGVVCKGSNPNQARTILKSTLAVLVGLALLPSMARADICSGTFADVDVPEAVATAFACGAGSYARGEYSTALGNDSFAFDDYSTSVGYSAQARGVDSIALGHDSMASGQSSIAIGQNSRASAANSIALGNNSLASQADTVSVGRAGNERRITNVAAGTSATDAVNVSQLDEVASNAAAATKYFKANGNNDVGLFDDAIAGGDYAIAVGSSSQAIGSHATAIGAGAQASSEQSLALGDNANASYYNAIAIGSNSVSSNWSSIAVGLNSQASGVYSIAMGVGAQTDNMGSVALGWSSKATGIFSTALGGTSMATGDRSLASGFGAMALGSGSTVLGAGAGSGFAVNQITVVGNNTVANADNATAVGARSYIDLDALNSTVIGAYAASYDSNGTAIGESSKVVSGATNAVALGSGSYADRANTVSVGSAGAERQIANVAAGTEDTDAVNKSQLDEVASNAAATSKYFKASGDDGLFDDALIDGAHTTAAGAGSSASGDGAAAFGYRANASGPSALAMGNNSTAGDEDAIAIGANSLAQAHSSTAVGANAQATGLYSSAFGAEAWAYGDGASVAVGAYSQAQNDFATAVGPFASAMGEGSSAFGAESTASGNQSLALGSATSAQGDYSLAMGTTSVAVGAGSIAIGGTYKNGTTERGNRDAVLQNVKTAISRVGLDRATISAKGATTPGVSASYQRKLAVGADLVRTSRKLNQSEANTLMAQIAADPSVAHVQPDYKMYAVKDFAAPVSMNGQAKATPQTFTPDDTYYAQYQWHFSDPTGGANINNAWDIADGTDVTVAVIDTGITQHPDLDMSLADAGYDFISDSFVSGRATDDRVQGGWDTGDWTDTAPWNDPVDGCLAPGDMGESSSWHGTHVSGTIAERTNNGEGMAGVAYNAKVLPIRALGHCGGYDSDISDAIEWASGGHVDGVPDNTHVAQVINMSLGGSGVCTPSSPEYMAIQNAISRGTTVVVAAGNSSADVSGFTPASCPGVIAVASNGITGKRAFYSNYGKGVTLSAPGGGIYPNDGSSGTPVDNGFVWSSINDGTTTPGNATYGGMAGTSQATPHVAGTVAMIVGATKAAGLATPSPADIANVLVKSARPFPVAQDQVIGAGILDAAAAVKLAVEGDTGNPGDGGNDPGTTLTKGAILSAQNIGAGSTVRYSITVPAGATTLNIRTIGGSGGDVSLYAKAGSSPAADGSDADFRSVKPGNNEAVVIQQPQATTYYILVVGGEIATSNLSVLVDYKQP